MERHDRHTDVRRASSLNVPDMGAGHNNNLNFNHLDLHCHGAPGRIVIFCVAVYIRPTPWLTTSLVLLFVNYTTLLDLSHSLNKEYFITCHSCTQAICLQKG